MSQDPSVASLVERLKAEIDEQGPNAHDYADTIIVPLDLCEQIISRLSSPAKRITRPDFFVHDDEGTQQASDHRPSAVGSARFDGVKPSQDGCEPSGDEPGRMPPASPEGTRDDWDAVNPKWRAESGQVIRSWREPVNDPEETLSSRPPRQPPRLRRLKSRCRCCRK